MLQESGHDNMVYYDNPEPSLPNWHKSKQEGAETRK